MDLSIQLSLKTKYSYFFGFIYLFFQTLATAQNTISIGSTSLIDLPTEITVPVTLASDQDLTSLNLEIVYNPALLTTEVEKIIELESRFTELGLANVTTSVDSTTGLIRWTVAGLLGDTVMPAGAGELLSITFSISKTLADQTTLLTFSNVTATDSAINIIPFRSQDGEVIGPNQTLGFGFFDPFLLPNTIEFFVDYRIRETLRSLEIEILLDPNVIETDGVEVVSVAERIGADANIVKTLDEETGLLKIIVTDPVNGMAIIEGAGSILKVNLTPKRNISCVDTQFEIINAVAVKQSRELFQPILGNVELTAEFLVAIRQSQPSETLQEGTTSDFYTVTLRAQPKSDVTIMIEFDNQVTVSPAILTFSPETWNEVRTVMVTAVDENSVEGTHTSTVSHRISSSDNRFDDVLTCDISITIVDFVLASEGGWNLISIPFELERSFVDLFGDIQLGKVWRWENTGQRAGLVPLDKSTEIIPSNGYWVYTTGKSTLEFPDESNNGVATSGQLEEGWNLFGPTAEITTPYNDNINGVIWFWEENLFKAVPREGGMLTPGKGYWINSKIPQVYP